MNGNANFLYSVGLAGFALLNGNGTMPTASKQWVDVGLDGSERLHYGGLISKSGTFNFSKLAGDDLKIGLLLGNKRAETTVTITATNKANVTIDELEAMLKPAIEATAVKNAGLNLKVDKVSYSGQDFVRIYEASNSLPFYTPIGLSGIIPQLTGLQGYVYTQEVKSVKTDFDKEAGKSVDVTSGQGIRCVVKEADKIKGLNLTISMAGTDMNILSMITGNRFNHKTDEFFIEGKPNTPSFAFIYFVKAFSKGENNESSFEKVKVVCYPSCQAALPGDNAQEGAFATTELSASGSQNKASALPLMFYKGVPYADYNNFVEAI